jgi:nucleotide-binding universal stress UspA family protein
MGITHKDRIEIGNSVDTILRVAREEKCDLILVGEAALGMLRRWLLRNAGLSIGSVASRVAELADVPVLVAR